MDHIRLLFASLVALTIVPAAFAQKATDPASLKLLPGFRAELLYSVPEEQQGSWVNLAVDPKGRLYTSDQYGVLYRVTPAPIGAPADQTKVEPVPLEIGEAQGLLWAFDSLYVVVNAGGKFPSGLYRVKDTNGDDQLDEVETLRLLDGGGEHGPHAVLLNPDGKNLTVVCGNGTRMTELAGSRVPRLWGEDHLLPRMPDGNGFMAGVLGPGGCIYTVDPDGTSWELLSTGYRNEYDAAFNRAGDLFTYDADMEWDVNTPWYRPTRVNLATSGSEYGWRNGAGKWPAYYADSLPAIVDIGPGSPTGVCFGYGAKFPAKYQEAFYISDWSYGKLYAVHLAPEGASYTGQVEEFVSGSPLPLTDVVVNPIDGAMYFTIGGRRTTSGLYRVAYQGNEAIAGAEAETPPASNRLRVVRLLLEQFHGKQDPKAVETAWPYLAHSDRFLRYAARVAVEHQPVDQWREKALAEKDPQTALEALLALIRASGPDPSHRKDSDPPVDLALKSKIVAALDAIAWDGLSLPQRLHLLRDYHVLFNRMGPPDEATSTRLIDRFAPGFPTGYRELDAEISQLLVYLNDAGIAGKLVDLLDKAPTQEEQMEYARSLRVVKAGWTPDLRKRYLSWFNRAAGYRGGSSLAGFLKNMKADALKNVGEEEKADLASILEAAPASTAPAPVLPRPFVKEWTLDELAPALENGLASGRDFDRGRALFGAAQCFACHRYAGEGGAVGPDLTGVAGRFSPHDLLESLLVPSKTISDQYQAVAIATTDGRVVTGRIANLNNDVLMVMTDMLDPGRFENVKRDEIDEMKPSTVSMMPVGLLNTLNRDEVLDLMAYMLSRGDRDAAAFAKPKLATPTQPAAGR